MDRGAWWATVHSVGKSATRLKQLSTYVWFSSQFNKHLLLLEHGAQGSHLPFKIDPSITYTIYSENNSAMHFSTLFIFKNVYPLDRGFPSGSAVKNSLQCRSCRRCGFDPWVGKISWRTAWLKNTHFRTLAWRILRSEEPSRQQSIESQRVRHNWTDLACTHSPYRLMFRKLPGNSAPYPGLNRNTYYSRITSAT